MLQVVTERAGLPPKNDVEVRKARARQDLHAALTDLAVARKLPPPPPLPAHVSTNRAAVARSGRRLTAFPATATDAGGPGT